MAELQIYAPQQNWRKQVVNRLGAGGAALATTATDGFLYVPTCAGVPTGVPTTLTGYAALVVDSTDNRLYFFSNGAWRNAGP